MENVDKTMAVLAYLLVAWGYAACGIWAYRLLRYTTRRANDNKWTVSDRRAGLLLVGATGPLGLIAATIIWLGDRPDNDTPAQW